MTCIRLTNASVGKAFELLGEMNRDSSGSDRFFNASQ